MKDTREMKEIPLGMSNFDGSIDEGFAEALQERPGEVFGRHAGWNFNGLVYFSGGKFHEEVRVWGKVSAVVSADSLPDLMEAVCEEYGYE